MRIIRQVLVFLTGVSAAMAQFAGTFTPTGNLTASRVFPRATLLPNGKVLITGSFPSARAELYDPSTGTFSAIGNKANLAFQSSTLLADGRVLIAGGEGPGGLSARAELYDPDTETFTTTGEMTRGRGRHLATLLANGKVLIVGGEATQQPVPLDKTAELYDPATGTFAVTGTFAGTEPYLSSSTLLPDGRVLIVGYYSSASRVYEPDTGTFSSTGGRGITFATFTPAILLTNGKVLFTGGSDEDGPDFGAELYDPATGAFTATGNMTSARSDHSATLLGDGTVLLAGSEGNGVELFGAFASTELYNPASGTFSATGDMATPRFYQAAVLLPDGTVLIAGGSADGKTNTRSAEIYHPAVLVPAPALLSLTSDGRGQGAILHSTTHQVVSPDNPAVGGETVEIYLTGLLDGSVIPPQVAVGGRMARVFFFGNAPGLTGLNQINVQVPGDAPAGPAVPVRLMYLGRPSNQVTIAVK